MQEKLFGEAGDAFRAGKCDKNRQNDVWILATKGRPGHWLAIVDIFGNSDELYVKGVPIELVFDGDFKRGHPEKWLGIKTRLLRTGYKHFEKAALDCCNWIGKLFLPEGKDYTDPNIVFGFLQENSKVMWDNFVQQVGVQTWGACCNCHAFTWFVYKNISAGFPKLGEKAPIPKPWAAELKSSDEDDTENQKLLNQIGLKLFQYAKLALLSKEKN
eukprot:TRINITY_DN4759_c0_g1_i1.p1 TRINITY_DN4759_c0_g1~~TRINITY_DN4759_c0_g1_i1.p1  ORF type:complete len:252 (+),score=37.30 TRINITY_DN4759_c0_g1_i1:114-758(+)